MNFNTRRRFAVLLALVLQMKAGAQPAPTQQELKGSDGPVYGLAWAPDGRTLASTGFRQVNLWRRDSVTPLRTFRMHTDLVRSVAWSNDGALIASVGDDGVAYVWNPETLDVMSKLQAGPEYSVKWSPDGTRIATAGATAMLQIWDVKSGTRLRGERLQTTISSLAWSSVDDTIAAGGINGLTTVWKTETLQPLAKMYVNWPDRNDVNGVTWSPSGKLLALAHGARGVGGVTYWDPAAGRVGKTLSDIGGWLRGISWSPDGQWLAVGGEDGLVRIVNIETSSIAATLTTDSKPVWSVAWSPDGTRLAAGNTGSLGPPRIGGTVTVWSEPVSIAPAEHRRTRAQQIEVMLSARHVLTQPPERPARQATDFRDGAAYGTLVRLEPPFGNLETSFVESDLATLRIARATTFTLVCREQTFTPLLGQHWNDVSRGEWVAYYSLEGNLIIGRNSASAADASGCRPGDAIVLRPSR